MVLIFWFSVFRFPVFRFFNFRNVYHVPRSVRANLCVRPLLFIYKQTCIIYIHKDALRISFYVLRITHIVSRITFHVSRFTYIGSPFPVFGLSFTTKVGVNYYSPAQHTTQCISRIAPVRANLCVRPLLFIYKQTCIIHIHKDASRFTYIGFRFPFPVILIVSF